MHMPVQTVNEGLASPKESVVSKEDLIQSVLDSLRQGRLDTAANLYARSTEDIGYELMNKAGRGEIARPLANMFLQVKDFYKAAQVFDRLDMKKEAAQSFEKAGDYDSAAELYASIGDMGTSAEMFERGGAYSRAAPLFEQAEKWLDAARNYAKGEEYFLAGRAFARGGDEKKALERLQKVPQDDASYPEAVDLLGPILERMGFTELAIDKYRGLVSGKSVTPENVKLFYRIARMQESAGRIEEARQFYARILEMNMGYEDVQQRYQTLKEGAQVRGGTSPAPSAAAVPGSTTRLIVLDEDTSVFETSVLFKDLTFDEKRSFLALAEKRAFKAGEPLLREGGPLPGLGIIHHGTVGVGMKLGGKNIKLRRFGPGDHFGEMTICGARNARVTAIAETDGDYVIMTGDRVGRFLEGNPMLAVKVLRNMMAAMDVHLDQFTEVVRAVWNRKGA
jgi:tetratricopeptide (TPR) repeat protein